MRAAETVTRTVARPPARLAAAGLALILAAPAGAAGPVAPASDPALLEVRRLAAAGAPRLALSRVERLQPEQPPSAPWAEWEALRLELLARLDDRQALFERVQRLNAEAPAKLSQTAFGLAARAAMDAGETRRAADFLRRQLWWGGVPDEPVQRSARCLVIDAFLAGGRPRDAYRAMLRFQQDFRPLAREESEAFVRGLASRGLGKEALSFAAALDAKHPLVVHAELGAGVTAPAAALRLAKAALARGDDADALRLQLDAARRVPDRSAEVAALERLLNRPKNAASGAALPSAGELAEAYGRLGQGLANAGQLLVGEDSAWFAAADKLGKASPAEARALWALLAKQARGDGARRQAAERLLASLTESGLALAAVRLFAADSPLSLPPDAADARRTLARLAAEAQAFGAAADYLQGVPPPAGTPAAEWQLEQARVLLAAGRSEQADAAAQGLGAGGATLSPAAAGKALRVGGQLLAAGRLDGAERTLQAALHASEGETRREALFALGELRRAQGRPAEAAASFLRCALPNGAEATDALAVAARAEAAAALAAAGWKDDAAAQWRWLARNVRDPALRELLAREAARSGS